MSNTAPTIDAQGGTTPQRDMCPPCVQVRDQDIYVLNPLYRLRNAKDHVLAHGAQGIGTYRTHRAIAIVLALCNGNRSIADIARITRPFVKVTDDGEATRIANRNVKMIVHRMSLTKEEQRGKEAVPSPFPASAALLRKPEYDDKFGHCRIPVVEYSVRDLLPKNESEICNSQIRVLHEATPIELNWHFTSECSTNCRYCYLGRRDVQPMPKERALHLIKEAAAIGILCIVPGGGDVLLYPHLKDVLGEMCEHKFLPAMVSTKAYLSKDKAKEIAEVSDVLWELQFSIDSTNGAVADYLVGAKGYCERILTSIDNALEVGLRVTAKAVITPYNILTIPKLYRDLKTRGVSQIRLATYGRSGYHHTDDLFNHLESYGWLNKELERLRKDFPGDNIFIQNGPPNFQPSSRESRQEAWPHRNGCTAGRSSMMICADGKVIPCEQMPETDEFFCGDVSYQSIQEVWNGQRLRELTYGMPREKFLGLPCYECEEREDCHDFMGYCIRDLSLFQKNIYQPPLNCPRFDQPFIRQI